MVEHIKPLVRGGDRIQKLKQRKSFWIHTFDPYPGLNEDVGCDPNRIPFLCTLKFCAYAETDTDTWKFKTVYSCNVHCRQQYVLCEGSRST